MDKLFVNFLPPWVETNIQPAFYDKESGSVLQQTARMYAKVNCLVRMFNKLSKETKETVDEYIAKFVELKDFVDTYFENLDVQEEINNKLDAMVEAGTLQEIISEYLNSTAVFGFDTVSDMKSATNLIDGSYAQTLGYYAKNDGGGATYKIREITNDDVVDEATIVAMTDNTLVAELIIKNNVNVKQFGAYGDGTHDDSGIFTKVINYVNAKGVNIFLPVGKYLIEDDLPTLDAGITLYGEEGNTSVQTESYFKSLILDNRNSSDYLIQYKTSGNLSGGGNGIYNVGFSNISENQLKCINFNRGGYKSNLESIEFVNYLQALNIASAHATNVTNVSCLRCGSKIDNGNVYAIEISNATDVVLRNCMIEHSRFMVYAHDNANKFVIDSCYFEIASACGYKGNPPIYINGGTITNSKFITRPVQTIATAINDTIDNTYYFIRAYSQCNISNNEFGIGGANDGTTDTNKQQGKFIEQNQTGTCIFTGNIFHSCAFDTPCIDMYGRDSIFSNNVVQILLEESTTSSDISKYVIKNYDRTLSSNNVYRIHTTKTAARQHEYFPMLARYNYIDYAIKSMYNTNTSFDFVSYGTPMHWGKTPTLEIQGDSGMFKLCIRNTQTSGTYYECYMSYNIGGDAQSCTVLTTGVNRLLNDIKFFKKEHKLVIQLDVSAPSQDYKLIAEDLNRGSFAFNYDIDALADTPIYTISS